MDYRIESVLEFIPKPKIKYLIEKAVDTHKDSFFTSPAACGNHHAYEGGLLDHSCSTAVLAGKICKHYHDMDIDRSVCVAGAFLHDFGKVKCYKKEGKRYRGTEENRLFHHIPIGFHLVASINEALVPSKQVPEKDINGILHIIISHHGRVEYSSPRRPLTPEARIVSEADLIDAYLAAPPDRREIYQK